MFCPRSFHAFSLSWLSMESCNRKLCTHKKAPCFRQKHYRKWKIIEIIPFSMENAWCSVVIVLLQTTRKSTATQETSKMAQRDLTYLYDNCSRREISLSYWHKGGEKQAWCSHPKYTYPLFNVQEGRAPWDPFGLGLVTNIALNISTPNQPKWGFLKSCKSVTLYVQYRQYFRLL